MSNHLDTLNTTQKVTELYLATLGRAPDKEGLAYWVAEVDAGRMSFADVSQSFFDQAETKALYPDLYDADGALKTTLTTEEQASFIIAVYDNALGRIPDEAGATYWMGELAAKGIARFVEHFLSGVAADSVDAGALAAQSAVADHFVEVAPAYESVDSGTYLAVAQRVLDDVKNADSANGEAQKAAVDYDVKLVDGFVKADMTGYALLPNTPHEIDDSGNLLAEEGATVQYQLVYAPKAGEVAAAQVIPLHLEGDTLGGTVEKAAIGEDNPERDVDVLPSSAVNLTEPVDTVTINEGETTTLFSLRVRDDGAVPKETEGLVVSVGESGELATSTIRMSEDVTKPVIATKQEFSYKESLAAGGVIGKIAVEEAGGLAAFSILSVKDANGKDYTGDGYFWVSSTGNLILDTKGVAIKDADGIIITPNATDFETGPSLFKLTVEARDWSGNVSRPTEITLNLLDVANEKAPVIKAITTKVDTTGDGTPDTPLNETPITYLENQANVRHPIGNIHDRVRVTGDEDVTYQIVAGDGKGLFAIDKDGNIFLTEKGLAEANDFYGDGKEYDIEVKALDADGYLSEHSVSLTLKVKDDENDEDGDEAPEVDTTLPTYKLAVTSTGDEATITLTTNVPKGTEIRYAINGVDPDYFDTATPTPEDVFVVGADGEATLMVSRKLGAGAEDGDYPFTVTIAEGGGKSTSKIVFTEDEEFGTPIFGKQYASLTSSGIGTDGKVTFTLTTNGVPEGTKVAYVISGNDALAKYFDEATLGQDSLTGFFVVEADGTTALNLTVAAENLTPEDIEAFKISLVEEPSVYTTFNAAGSTGGDATYELVADASEVVEGNAVTVTLNTTNVAEGTELAYTITGVEGDGVDITEPLTGTFVVGAAGEDGVSSTTLTLNVLNDGVADDGETLSVTLDNGLATASVTTKDGGVIPLETYALTADVSDVTEGGTVTVTLETTNVPDGIVAYTIEGAAVAEDFVNRDSLTGEFEVVNGSATLVLEIANDGETEGPEAFTITLDGKTTTTPVVEVTINDGGGTPDNTPPVITTDSTNPYQYKESATAGTLILDVDAADADGDTITYSLSNETNVGFFAIDRETGELTLTQLGAGSDALGETYTVDVTADDGKGGTNVRTFSLVASDADGDIVAAGESNATGSPKTFHVIPSADGYTHTINGFSGDDKLELPVNTEGNEISFENNDFGDGLIDVVYESQTTGTSVRITLTGLTTAQDNLFEFGDLSEFTAAFGAGTLVLY